MEKKETQNKAPIPFEIDYTQMVNVHFLGCLGMHLTQKSNQ